VISWIARSASSLEGLGFLFTLMFGVGGLGYLAATWITHFLRGGMYVAAGLTAVGAGVLSAAAAFRIPIALVLFFGAAAIAGIAFLGGYGRVLLP
jgi:hypothetical protein